MGKICNFAEYNEKGIFVTYFKNKEIKSNSNSKKYISLKDVMNWAKEKEIMQHHMHFAYHKL